MDPEHHHTERTAGFVRARAARRALLTLLYDRYFQDPLDMLDPDDLMSLGQLTREELVASAYYLHDCQFIELMMGYNPPLFAAARITAKGIDLVEDHYAFNLRFPPESQLHDQDMGAVPVLMEKVMTEIDNVALDRESRVCMVRDAQYLREELARSPQQWRTDVIRAVISWIERWFTDPYEEAPSLMRLRDILDREPDPPQG